MIKNKIFYITCLGLLALASCKKLNQGPTDKYTDLNYWTTPDAAQSLLNTAYMQMFRSDYFFYNEGLSDNAYVGRGDQNNTFTISSGSFNPSLGRFDDEWTTHFQGIKSCNVLLDNIDKIPNYPAADKALVVAQTRFIRAFEYWQLMTWFGDVPLFDHDITLAQSQTITRTPRAQVLSFVLSELDAVKSALPSSWDKADLGRITNGAAAALKARVELYEGNWSDVAAICDTLIHKGTYGSYSLMPVYDSIFTMGNEHNSEVLLDEEFVPLKRTYAWMFDFIPISAGARDNALAPTQELVNDYLMLNGDSINQAGSGYNANNPYINRDPRMTATIVYDKYLWHNVDGTTQTIYIKPGSDPSSARLNEYVPNGGFSSPTGYYIRKYWDPTAAPGETSGLDLILIRYADVLLMYAEAMNELNKMDAGTWTETIGALRTRAGFNAAAALYNAAWSQTDLRTIIRRERRCELAFEGLRIFDIRRWKTAETVLNGWVHGAQFSGDPTIDNGYIRAGLRAFNANRQYLWPVPTAEIAEDPNLTQNPNY